MSSALAYANCMRSHGVPDFPDPDSQAEFQLRPIKSRMGVQLDPTLIDGSIDHNFNPGLNVNPSSPAFLQAANKCGHGQPGLVGPG